jgi:hypothetical protein
VIAEHATLIEGREVFTSYPIRVRLSRPEHQCDGNARNFALLEWHNQFGTGKNVQEPSCP